MNSLPTSFLRVTYTERFLKVTTLPSTAGGGLLSRLAVKVPTYLTLSICTGSSQELRSTPPEQKNAEGQCLVGGKSCERSSAGLRANLWLSPNFSDLHNAKSNKIFMDGLSHLRQTKIKLENIASKMREKLKTMS